MKAVATPVDAVPGDPAFVDAPRLVVEGVPVWSGQKVARSRPGCPFRARVRVPSGPAGAARASVTASISAAGPTICTTFVTPAASRRGMSIAEKGGIQDITLARVLSGFCTTDWARK